MLSLVGGGQGRRLGEEPAASSELAPPTTTILASVVVVISPGGLSVWAPKEEVVGMLDCLGHPDRDGASVQE